MGHSKFCPPFAITWWKDILLNNSTFNNWSSITWILSMAMPGLNMDPSGLKPRLYFSLKLEILLQYSIMHFCTIHMKQWLGQHTISLTFFGEHNHQQIFWKCY